MPAAALREIRKVMRRPGEPRLRWFHCNEADLFVWSRGGAIHAFEFCYDKERGEHALRWRSGSGFSQFGVDAGEDKPTRKRSPIAVADGKFDLAEIAQRFQSLARGVDRRIYGSVLDILRGRPGGTR